MERCFTQSPTTLCSCLSKTPSLSPKAMKNTQKTALMISAIRKQFFLPQLVMKKVSIPSFTEQMSIRDVVQKGKSDSSGQMKLTMILIAKKTVSPTIVMSTLENQVTKGQSFTCQYSILRTDTSCSIFSFFFLGLTYVSGLGGRKRAAPLGKKRKLGYLSLMQCRPTKREMSKTASNIMLNYQITIQNSNYKTRAQEESKAFALFIYGVSNYYYNYRIMLFGQWQDEKDRERKQIKTKIYKEMLDNQILINERYKREKRNLQDQHNESQLSEKRHPYRRQHIKTENAPMDLDMTVSRVKNKSKQINLPAIKDKNTYYQGSSKFIKVEDPRPKPPSQSPFHPEMLDEQEDDLDQYNNTCQKIIRELKGINRQTPKMKYRRKLYEYSDLAPNRKRYEKTKIEEIKSSEVQLYNKYDYARTNPKQDAIKNQFSQVDSFSIKTKAGSDDRVPSFSMVSPSRQPPSETSKTRQKPIFNQARFKQKQEYPANQFEEVSAPQTNSKVSSPLSLPRRITEPSEYSTVKMSTNIPPKTNNLDRSRIKSNVDMTKGSPSQVLTQSEQPQQPKTDLKLHKENFINLLRKVKNRGQSLFIKLNAFPSKNQPKQEEQ